MCIMKVRAPHVFERASPLPSYFDYIFVLFACVNGCFVVSGMSALDEANNHSGSDPPSIILYSTTFAATVKIRSDISKIKHILTSKKIPYEDVRGLFRSLPVGIGPR